MKTGRLLYDSMKVQTQAKFLLTACSSAQKPCSSACDWRRRSKSLARRQHSALPVSVAACQRWRDLVEETCKRLPGGSQQCSAVMNGAD